MFVLTRIFPILCMAIFLYAYKIIRTDLQLPQGKILGGDKAKIINFPYMVKLYIRIEQNTILCGGTYIASNWVMTAAHCLDIHDVTAPPSVGRGNRIECIMGTDRHRRQPGHQSIKSFRLFHHPQFFRNETHVEHDIGLVLLKTHFNLTRGVNIAVLPRRSINYAGATVTILGYGLSKINVVTGEVTVPQQLQMLTTKVHSNKFCQKLTHSSDVICIGKKGKISCTGDSGGPMIFRKRIIGVCSYGFGCTAEYGIYENVFRNKEWIDKMIGDTSLQTRSGNADSIIVNGVIFYIVLFIVYFFNITFD